MRKRISCLLTSLLLLCCALSAAGAETLLGKEIESGSYLYTVQDDGTAKVGISRYAADELGEINFIELPEVNASFEQGQQLCIVESVKAASDVFMPVAATITSVNRALETDPSVLNDDPENAGWICIVKGFDPAQLEGLMTEEQYSAFCKG